MKRFKPTLWLSFALVSVTLAVALIAYVLGLMPDGHKAELNSRAKVAESLAIQMAGAANRNDTTTLEETVRTVVERNPDVLSAAMRNNSGKIIVSSGDHDEKWVQPDDGKSTPTHVTVPLVGADGEQGRIEILFGPPSAGARYFGIPLSLILFMGFMTASGFTGYFFLLRRTLHELDPGRVIPERVQKAFDTLSEGVIILDEKERILLINSAFEEFYEDKNDTLIGTKINTLPWRMVDGSAQAGGYPWHTALREGREMREDLLSLRTRSGEIHNFNVNATIIAGDNGKAIGAIVTLKDMTSLKLSKEELQKTADQLKVTEEEIKRQKDELAYLTQYDPLTGCLNRRAYYNRLETDLDKAAELNSNVTVVMIDLDNFKTINDDFGPASGDKIISGVAEILKNACGDNHYVSRTGGDEFCMTLLGDDKSSVGTFGEAIRETILDESHNLLPGGVRITVSIGIADKPAGECNAHKIVHRANSALNAAKKRGRNNVTNWENIKNTPSAETGRSSDKHHVPTEPVNQAKAIKTSSVPATGSMPAAKVNPEDVFVSKVDLSIAQASRADKPVAVLQLCIVSWDYLAEALGESYCEKVLRATTRTITNTLREQDEIVCHRKSGEFSILLSGLEEAGDTTWIVKRLLEALRNPVTIGDQSMYVACKVGISLYPNDGRETVTLMRNAGVAMRRALRENLLDGFKYYSAEMTQDSLQRLDIETGIRSALENNEFELFFQPIVDAKTGQLSAAEALLRCHNEKLSGVRMDRVIDVAEKSSLIAEIDEWVLENALNQMHEWCDSGYHLPKISINLSAKQLTNLRLMDRFYNRIKDVRFSPSRVQLEVTETARMSDVEVAAPQLKRFQQLGALIALDDFGTGQASLTYLQRLHPDVIKIDKSFADGVNINHANATLVSAMTVMAHCLGLKVVVEGIEDQEQFDFLRDTRCDEIQGYFISKPMPGAMMTEWMEKYVAEHGARPYSERLISLAPDEEAESTPPSMDEEKAA